MRPRDDVKNSSRWFYTLYTGLKAEVPSMPKGGVTITDTVELIAESEYIECECGNAIFIDGSQPSSLRIINFYREYARLEPQAGFFLDVGDGKGWYCLQCASKHPRSKDMDKIFKKWIKREKKAK